MRGTISKWGNSLGVRLPKPIAEKSRLGEGSAVDIAVTADGSVIISPARKRVTLDDLLAKCDPTAPLSADRDWMDAAPVGLEVS